MLIRSSSKGQVICKHAQVLHDGFFWFIILYIAKLVVELAISHEKVKTLFDFEMSCAFEVYQKLESDGLHEDNDGCVDIESILSCKIFSKADVLDDQVCYFLDDLAQDTVLSVFGWVQVEISLEIVPVDYFR